MIRTKIVRGVALIVFCLVAIAVPDVRAQGASIRGKVTDETGGALPGVTIEASSPALLVPQLTETTGADGEYALQNLPIGQYRVVFNLAGFQQFIREEIQLSQGFTATINVTMKIGGLAENLTVSGASPVVDVQSTTLSSALSATQLSEVLPVNTSIGGAFSAIPGTGRATDTGAGSMASGGQDAYGISLQYTVLIEGVNTRQGSGITQGFGPDMASLEEAQLVTVGGTAEQPTPGTFASMIVKSGGNAFHGRYELRGQTDRFQNNNVSPELAAQGLQVGSSLKSSHDFTADLGGPIKQNRLWFYGAARDFHSQSHVLGFKQSAGPDRVYGTADDVLGLHELSLRNQTAKLTYQIAPKYRLVGFFTRNPEVDPQYVASFFVPFEATRIFKWTIRQTKAELQGTPSGKFLFNVQMGQNHYDANYYAQDGFDGVPSARDITSQYSTGPAFSLDKRPRTNLQPTGWVQFDPERSFLGRHELKAGFQYYNEQVATNDPNAPHGNYQLIFSTQNGIPHQPLQITTYNYPFSVTSHLNTLGLYVQDLWRLGSRTTLNVGLRYDRFAAYVPAQSKEQGQFGGSGTFPRIDVGTWPVFGPRLGLAYDLTGDAKTVLKASWGWYNNALGDDFANFYAKNTGITTTYRWRDLNSNGDYDPGEVNLDLNGPDFISTAQIYYSSTVPGGVNNLRTPGLKDPHSTEAVVSVDRELMANFGVRVDYLLLRDVDAFATRNVLRPASAYTVEIPLKDPGRDGVLGTGDDGGSVTVYDYPAALRGNNFVANAILNTPHDRLNRREIFEVAFNRRKVGRWSLLGSANWLWHHDWTVPFPVTPNDEYFNLNTARDWQAKATGNYDLPFKVTASASAVVINGINLVRTTIFQNIPSQGTATLRMEAAGDRRASPRSSFHMKISKTVPLKNRGRVGLTLEALNVLNRASINTESQVSGPTFGQITGIDAPRVLRFGASFTF